MLFSFSTAAAYHWRGATLLVALLSVCRVLVFFGFPRRFFVLLAFFSLPLVFFPQRFFFLLPTVVALLSVAQARSLLFMVLVRHSVGAISVSPPEAFSTTEKETQCCNGIDMCDCSGHVSP